MDDSDPSSLTEVKERTPFNQVVTSKASTMQRVLQVAQRVAQKGCRRACQLFCCPIDGLLCEKLTCCHQHVEGKTTQVAHQNLPSTILIVNISNSTLIDCVIGKDTYLSANVAECQPLMQESGLQMHGDSDRGSCSCSRGQQVAAQTSAPPSSTPLASPCLPSAEPPSINIHSSQLNCVIIGDNNYMQADQTLPAEPEEPHV